MALSAVLITHNAGALLERCLASVAFADEILLVDSGSSDDTVAIAERHGARIIEHEWLGFGPQKQFAVETAANDWVLCLDADERVSDALKKSIVEALRVPSAEAYQFARRNRFLGRWLSHGEGYPDWSLRLYHRAHGRWSEDPVHERVVVDGRVQQLKGDLLHDSAESMHRYLEKQNRYTTLQAERLHALGRVAGIAQLLLSPVARFLKFYVFRLGFLDGVPGLVHIAIGCMNSFNKYAKLIALNKANHEVAQ